VIASLLVRQIVRPVLWVKCVRSLLDAGADTFLEAGPGNVLTRLVAQIRARCGDARAGALTPWT
ncbi:ACP S-malonyltransferase, partial [Streptomyces sp. S9]|nr:ACP S-malonyltransferase [Streptomyces sp. S9]